MLELTSIISVDWVNLIRWFTDFHISLFILFNNCEPSHNAYRQVSNIRRTLVGNKIVDNSDVVGASPVGAAPTTSSLST